MADVLLLRQTVLMERDTEEAATHLCKEKKKARPGPHFHWSGVKTPRCSDILVRKVPDVVGSD